MGVSFFILGLFMCFPNFKLPSELFIACVVVVFLFDYILDKYLKYFKEFDKKPRKWKIKWARISLGVILLQFIFFLLSGLVLNLYF